jgi:hypothetical protein
MKKKSLIPHKYINPFLIAFLLFISFSCIEEYANAPNLSAEVLIVEGLITNQVGADTIEVSFSKGTGVNGEITPVKDCKLQIITEDGMLFDLKEDSDGKYYTPSNLRAKFGKTYQLRLKTPNGNSYESTIETMTKTSKILEVYDVFDEKAILSSNGRYYGGGNNVYVNLKDPVDEKNFYLWKYRYYEKLVYCKTCYNSRLAGDLISCEKITGLLPNQYAYNYYDYECSFRGSCWDIIYGQKVNAFSDIYSNGQAINGKLIGTIPFQNYTGALVEIGQYSISEEGYRFYNLLDLQGQKTGSLTDTPPSAIVGNIRNISNAGEAVVGFFGASDVTKFNYFLDRSKNKGLAKEYLGHTPLRENLGKEPPFALCVESRTRTKIKPEGWPK